MQSAPETLERITSFLGIRQELGSGLGWCVSDGSFFAILDLSKGLFLEGSIKYSIHLMSSVFPISVPSSLTSIIFYLVLGMFLAILHYYYNICVFNITTRLHQWIPEAVPPARPLQALQLPRPKAFKALLSSRAGLHAATWLMNCQWVHELSWHIFSGLQT